MKKIILIIFIALFIIVMAGVIFVDFSLNHRGSGPETDFIILEGQTTKQIARELKSKDLITNATVFAYYAKYKAALMQIGTYKLSNSTNMKGILAKLTSGKSDQDFITIPEGYRVTQIDELLASKGIIKAGELTKIAASDEGYLFPDTYRFTPNITAAEIKKQMMDNFFKKTEGLKVTPEVVNLASIVEREAKFDEDRPKIAGVYANRLAQNMKLEADPTIQYAKGNWNPIKVSDYHSFISPYNTYLNIGLPPGPICNPGLKSLQAALNPDQTNSYLFFINAPDGHAYFAKTLQEQEDNIKKYQ